MASRKKGIQLRLKEGMPGGVPRPGKNTTCQDADIRQWCTEQTGNREYQVLLESRVPSGEEGVEAEG